MLSHKLTLLSFFLFSLSIFPNVFLLFLVIRFLRFICKHDKKRKPLFYYDHFTEQFLPAETPRPPSRLLHMLRNRRYAFYMLRRAFSHPWLNLQCIRPRRQVIPRIGSCGCIQLESDQDIVVQTYPSHNIPYYGTNVNPDGQCQCPCHFRQVDAPIENIKHQPSISPSVSDNKMNRPSSFGGKVWHKRKPVRNPCPWIQPLGRASTAPPMADYSAELIAKKKSQKQKYLPNDETFKSNVIVVHERHWCPQHGWVVPRAVSANADLINRNYSGNNVDGGHYVDDTEVNYNNTQDIQTERAPTFKTPKRTTMDDVDSLFNDQLFADYIIPLEKDPDQFF